VSKDMQSYYRFETSQNLRKLYSKKFLRLTKLNSMSDSWFNRKEKNALLQQMKWIEVELASRDAQLALF